MGKKLFAGNLPFTLTEDALHSLFSAQGKVTSTKLISDKFSGQSKGFGFIEMDDDKEAEQAIIKLHAVAVAFLAGYAVRRIFW